MVAIHKSEAKSVVTSYRGISLLDILSKVLEKQVYEKLSNIVLSHISVNGNVDFCQVDPLFLKSFK